MKQIGKLVGDGSREGLNSALERLERAREARGASKVPERSQEARSGPERGREPAAAGVRSLARERARRKHEQVRQLIDLAQSVGVQGEALAIVKRSAEAAAGSGNEDWVFVMISPAQNAAVVEWLSENSKRPQVAVRLWAQLFAHLRSDTGEITQTRQELAERLGILPRHLSSIMSELEQINAIRREKSGRQVRYFMNANIATHLPHNTRRAAQSKAGPLLALMEGPKP